MEPERATELWFPFLAAFVFLWFAALWLLARVGGWASLAAVYPVHTEPAGERFGWQSVQLNNWFGYNGSVNIVAGIQGLHLSVFFLFRPFHPPVYVPWSEIQAHSTRLWWFIPAIRLTFLRAPGVQVHVAKPLFTKLSTASHGQLAAPPDA